MKRKFLIILVIQSVLIFGFLTYAFYQQTVAEHARMEAYENLELAKKNEQLLNEQIEECEDRLKNR